MAGQLIVQLLQHRADAGFGALAHLLRRGLGQALVRERLMAKPATPLTRHWMDALEMS